MEEEGLWAQRGGFRLLPFETRQRCNGTLSDTAAATRPKQAHTYRTRALKPFGARRFPPHTPTHHPFLDQVKFATQDTSCGVMQARAKKQELSMYAACGWRGRSLFVLRYAHIQSTSLFCRWCRFAFNIHTTIIKQAAHMHTYRQRHTCLPTHLALHRESAATFPLGGWAMIHMTHSTLKEVDTRWQCGSTSLAAALPDSQPQLQLGASRRWPDCPSFHHHHPNGAPAAPQLFVSSLVAATLCFA